MKKITLICALVALFFTACQNPFDKKYTIIGTWSCQEVNDLYIPTNDMVVCDFEANGSVTYMRGVKGNGSSTMFESELMNYQMTDESLTIKGIGDNAIEMHFRISYLDDENMDLTRTLYKENGVTDSTRLKMTFRKVNGPSSYASKILGSWDGFKHKTASQYDSLATIKMNFQAQNGFAFSEKYNTGWADRQGSYKLYGDVLVVNYADEFRSAYDCWKIKSMNEQEMMIEQYYKRDSTASLGILRYKMIKE